MFICLSGRLPMYIHGGFETEAQAETWAQAANIWYGRDHPLHPVRVESLPMNPKRFPAEALQAMDAARTPAESDAALHALFATLVDDPAEVEDPTPRSPGFIGGRKR